MYSNLVKISTVGMEHSDWLAHRARSIGGSDAAAIVGLSKWATPYSIWAEKLGHVPPAEDNEAMRQGRDLEDYVAQRFCEATGKKVRRENHIIMNPRYPFAHANVDRLIVGEDAGLECKTTSSLDLKKFKDGEYPDHYYVQCVHYMMVTGAKRWYLAVLVFGKGFYVYCIERDEDEIAALARSEEAFWQHVTDKVPPMCDGQDATTEAIGAVYSDVTDTVCDLGIYEADIAERHRLTGEIKALKKLRDAADNRIKSFMGNAGRGVSGSFNVTWNSSERSVFDRDRFAADHPDIDLTPYFNITTSRTFRVTERKDI